VTDPPAPPLSLSIVVPAFNEERRLTDTLQRLTAYLRDRPWSWEVRVVDDGSTDRTVAVVEAFRASEPRVIVQREPHGGKGRAVKAGLLAAAAEYRFICDADLSMPPHELARFLPPALVDFDVAIGTREGINAHRIGEPFYRHLMGRLFNTLVQAFVVPGIEDTQCGFKMFTARAVSAIFPSVTVNGWAFDIEVLALARQRRLRIVEVPIEWHYGEESQVSMLRDGAGMLRDLLRIRSHLTRSARGDPDAID
jgi:dolichyl-phosphate beta-glucosyltransferase